MSTERIAKVALAKCQKSKQLFGIRMEQKGYGTWELTWAFALDARYARKEGYDKESVNGSFSCGPEYPGCPYCGSRQWVKCTCGKLGCWHGEGMFTCPWCGRSGEVVSVESMSIEGGGM